MERRQRLAFASTPIVIALVLLLLVQFGCDTSGSADEDTAIDTGVQDTVVEIEEDTSPDPEEDVVPDSEEDPVEDTARDCAGMYPGGPFGFKGSIYRATPDDPGTWDGNGDLIQNICMRNQDDVYTCVAPYYCSSTVDVLIYDFTAIWCAPCNRAAPDERAFVEWMAEHGWTVEFLSMVEEDETGDRPTLEDAQYWRDYHDIEGPIMWDYNWVYHRLPFTDLRPEESARGWPTFMIVNPDNMLIWDAFSGWNMETSLVAKLEYYESILQILEMGAANDPGYIP